MTLKVSKEDAPIGFSPIGLFKTWKEVNAWYNAAQKAGETCPFWLTHIDSELGKRYILFWKKQKNAKKCGKGFKGG